MNDMFHNTCNLTLYYAFQLLLFPIKSALVSVCCILTTLAESCHFNDIWVATRLKKFAS